MFGLVEISGQMTAGLALLRVPVETSSVDFFRIRSICFRLRKVMSVL